MKQGEYFIVSLRGDRFLGLGGNPVSEYPDARCFPTRRKAQDAVDEIVSDGGVARAVSSVDYAEGAE